MQKQIDGLERATSKLARLGEPTARWLPPRLAIQIWTLEDYGQWLLERLREDVDGEPKKTELKALISTLLMAIDSLDSVVDASTQVICEKRIHVLSRAAREALLELKISLPMPEPVPGNCVLDQGLF
ncbi:hypothetical protein QIF44_13350 [Stenotrophomonas indicatrix]|uniref:hypothetical protein n=1 Tax=Stenotrophomonas indicatrix TaxID=2045451 RepID=UPI00249A35C7|nr:hypothetical protein [Stenotrophomonas indicatrix]WGV53293.1 hypothetical protein QIF44_13350 [Stenotrophomonas indicatrix]